MSFKSVCVDDSCVPSRSGGFCLVCGQTFRENPVPEDVLEQALARFGEEESPLDPNDPNYWIYLMHDLEIIAEPVELSTNASLAFYGKVPTRKAR